MRYLHLLALASLTFAGCTHIETYPQTWDPITVGQDRVCGNPTGKYWDIGEKPNGDQISLAAYLNPRSKDLLTPPLSFQPAHVELSLLDEKLFTVVASDDKGNRTEWSFSRDKGEFDCGNGFLSLKRGEAVADKFPIIAGVGYVHINIYRLRDYLVINDSVGNVGIVLVVPVVQYLDRWSRFRVTN